MRTRLVLFAASMAAVLILAAPRAQAQIVGGGYVGFGTPGVMGFGGPVVAPGAFIGAPMVPYCQALPDDGWRTHVWAPCFLPAWLGLWPSSLRRTCLPVRLRPPVALKPVSPRRLAVGVPPPG